MTQTERREKLQELNAQLREMNAESENYGATKKAYDDLMREYNMQSAFETNARENAPKKDVKTIVAQVREAMNGTNKAFTIKAGVEERSGEIVKNTHTTDVELQGLLEPLYTNSVLSKLGARFYTGMPQGDIQVPIMGKGTVGWATEVAAAAAAGQTFTHVTLQPKRLTAYIDISKAFILADSIGAEAAIRRDLVNAINDKLEATIFGYAASSTTQPAGMFFGHEPADATTFAKVCGIEATVEEANVSGEMKYLLSPKAKADLRSMAKSTKNTQLVLEGGTVDGVTALVSNNVVDAASTTKGCYIYGNWSNLAIGVWGDIDVTVDEYSQAVNGCVRLVVNAYFDEQVLRSAAFAYGDTRYAG